jgi:protoporphyrinogen oxidase
MDDASIARLQREELGRIFPAATSVLVDAEPRIRRWHGFPQFRSGWLRRQQVLREPIGSTYFCGDYTAQPGTPGAVGSGYHTALAVDRTLDRDVATPVGTAATVPQRLGG